jgi:hypothetical protein
VEFFLASQVESLPPANTVLSLNGFRLAPAPRGYPFQSNRFLAQAFDNKRTARDLMTEDRSKRAGTGKSRSGPSGFQVQRLEYHPCGTAAAVALG